MRLAGVATAGGVEHELPHALVRDRGRLHGHTEDGEGEFEESDDVLQGLVGLELDPLELV